MPIDPPFTASRQRQHGVRVDGGQLVAAPGGRFALPAPVRQQQQGGIDFGLLLRTVVRRLPIIIALAMLGGALGYALQTRIKPRYTSYLSLLLEPKRSDSFGADTQFGNMYVDSAKIASVVSVIESSDLLGRVVLAEHLDEIPEFGDPVEPLKYRLFGWLPFVRAPIASNDPDARAGRALGQLERAVRVERVPVTYVLTIEARASNPELARRLASAVAETYLDDQVQRKMEATQRDSVWLTKRLDGVRADLKQSEEALDTVRRKYGLLETDGGAGATLDRQALTELNAELTKAQADVATLKARYEQVERARAGGSVESLPDVVGSRVIEALRAQQAALAQKLTALRAVYNDSFPDVRHAEDDQRAIQDQIAAEVARIVDGRRSEYEAAVAREQELRQRLQRSVSPDGSGTGGEGREQVRDAQRLVDANRGLYDSLLNRWRDLQQQQTREEPEGRIISPASLADAPSWPKPLLLPAGGAAAMFLLGLGLTLGPALLENRFVSVTSVEQRLGLPVLGAIPMLRRRDLAVARFRQNIAEYAGHRPLSRFAESLRMLRAYLSISATDGASSIIQVTSAIPGEGKSTVAAALAVSAATAGVRTVLIDADLRTSSVSAMFGLQYEDGLSDALRLGLPAASLIRSRDDMPLAILGAGSSLLPQPDIINSSRFASLLRELSAAYSLVIIDGPPVLPVSDALVIAKQADATIMVVRWRATARDLCEQAVKALRSVNAPLAGVLLNKIDLSKVSQYECGYPNYGQPAGKSL